MSIAIRLILVGGWAWFSYSWASYTAENAYLNVVHKSNDQGYWGAGS